MENRLKDYLDYLDLGDELYECDRRMVKRKTRTVIRGAAGTTIIETTDEIEFT